MKRIELLSPAGDLERLKVTLLYGADAVYIGGEKYNLRANATNFSLDDIREGCRFAHRLGKKVHFTLNIAFHNSDLIDLKDYIREVVDAGVDAFIVSDVGVAKYIIDNYSVEVHISTQDSTTNYLSAKYYESIGANRVVLARELSHDEISTIIDKTSIDIEVFIHGAMCTCFSGRCALSNYITGRDANRGGCAQVCRFSFDTGGIPFTMASKDLNMSYYIRDLIDMGVTSMKVEGRMRSIYYLAVVIGTYRKIIDDYYNNSLDEENMNRYNERLSSVANRETSTQYFLHEADYTDQYFTGRQEVSNQEYLGLVLDYSNSLIKIKERNYFKVGDRVEVFTPSGEYTRFIVDKLYDEDMNDVSIARHPDNIYYIGLDSNIKIPEYSMIKMVEVK